MKKNVSHPVNVFIILVSLFAGSFFFTSCYKSPVTSPDTPVAGLMAFNLAPDKSPIGITLSGSSLLNSPLNYAGYTGNYLTIYPGNTLIEALSSNTSFTNSQYIFDTSKYYSLFVVGNNGTYQNLLVRDNVETLNPINGTAYVRYVNAIADTSKPLVNITSGSSNIVNGNVAFTAVSAFVPIPAGNVQVSASNGGNINAGRTIALDEKKAYTILLMGSPAATDTVAKVQIRFIQNGGL